ncbi:MAG: hypothetical protein ACTSPM_13250, partial [Candidatus Heimdallarchaeota archaeon]
MIGKDRFSLNLPPRYLSAEISMTEDYDFQFIANLFMHKSLSENIIEKQLNKTLETLRNSVESFSKEKSLVIIQPTKSERIFEKILTELNDLELQNIAITNLLPFINNSRQMVDFIANLKATLPFNSLLFSLSPIPHTHMPILAYSGIDVFSNGFANIAAKQRLYLTDSGGEKLEDLN